MKKTIGIWRVIKFIVIVYWTHVPRQTPFVLSIFFYNPVLRRLQLSIVLMECDTCGNLDVPAFNTSGKLYQASHGQVNRAPAWRSSW